MEKYNLKAIIFDFDGTILDTEMPEFLSWQELYQEFALELPFDLWVNSIGTINGFDPLAHLEKQVGTVAPVRVRRVEQRHLELIQAQPVQPGVQTWLAAAKAHPLSLAIASSSQHAWVKDNLSRLGLLSHFPIIVGRDDAGHQPKPNPAVYQTALARLGIQPNEAIAIEDSRNGVAAAKAAGLYTLYVPNDLTKHNKDAAADHTISSLAEFTLLDLFIQLGTVA
ncbi:MAG: HAD-IA family hydrolase [Chloroflexi bacterium]|nr:HAD-IA family hydrolase [Chloroflexota bacterium]MBP8056779.1 HAD-IA family hydrolase [Chloroflexota bacterium]